MKNNIMAVGAHADDIELGAGGTLLKYFDRDCRIIYVMATNNMSGGHKELLPDGTLRVTRVGPLQSMERRKSECSVAARRLGTEPVHLDHPQRHYYDPATHKLSELRYGCGLPEGVSPGRPSILTAHSDKTSVRRLVDMILGQNPACVLTHGPAQQNIEHMAVCLLVTRSFWTAVQEGYQGALLYWLDRWDGYCTHLGGFYSLWETFVEISDYVAAKQELVALHKSQMPRALQPDSFICERVRQWGLACGCAAAEVFVFADGGKAEVSESESSVLAELMRNRRSRCATGPESAVLSDVRVKQAVKEKEERKNS